MRLVDALVLSREGANLIAPPFRVFLATGFTPIHLQTFVSAHLHLRLPERQISISTGLFGDVSENIARIGTSPVEGAAVVLEWADLDPRLGIRRLGGWGPSEVEDIVVQCRRRAATLGEALKRASHLVPVVICMATLPLPPVFLCRGVQADRLELRLRAEISAFAATMAESPLIKVVNAQFIDRHSRAERFDVKGECDLGFPYTVGHAAAVAEALALLIHDQPLLKGLITDLDNTLWRGILGEVGVDGVTWSLDGHSQLHGVYQQVLRSLAQSGVLVAAASKNDATLVDAVFTREDLHIRKEDIFPFEVHWDRKSASVTRILNRWNIAADSVMFIDDSPLELAEVKSVHPAIHCILFPADSAPEIYNMLGDLRDRFGKDAVSEEDAIRAASIRGSPLFEEGSGQAAPDEFLSGLQAEVSLAFVTDALDPRVLELVNKTNQFNLNGKRYSHAEWVAGTSSPDSFVLVASYKDKFGPLGKIGVMAGERQGSELRIHTWVMSCRAFSRRIEHQCLEQLFTAFPISAIRFGFARTDRNHVLEHFLESLLGEPPTSDALLSREVFRAKVPQLFHRVALRS